MLRKFVHDGLHEFWWNGSTQSIQKDLVKRVKVRLSVMNAATNLSQIRACGWDLHQLKGDRKGTWSLSVNGSIRITFRWDNGDCVDVNLEQYH
jgi:proteic killer suppression protein